MDAVSVKKRADLSTMSGNVNLPRNIALAQNFETLAEQDRRSALRIVDVECERGQATRPGE